MKKPEVQPPVKKRQISLDNTNMFDLSSKKQKKTDFRIPKKNRPQDAKKGEVLEKVIKDLKKTPKAAESSQKADRTPAKTADKPYKPPGHKSDKTPQKPSGKTPGKPEKSHKKKASSGEKSSEAPKIKMNAYAQSEKKNKDKFKAL